MRSQSAKKQLLQVLHHVMFWPPFYSHVAHPGFLFYVVLLKHDLCYSVSVWLKSCREGYPVWRCSPQAFFDTRHLGWLPFSGCSLPRYILTSSAVKDRARGPGMWGVAAAVIGLMEEGNLVGGRRESEWVRLHKLLKGVGW